MRNFIKLIVMALVIASAFFSAENCLATVVTLPATADAGTKSQFPTTNFGSGSYMYNFYQSGNKGRSFMKFDLSSIPANSTIINTFVSIYNMANDGADCNGDPGLFYISMANADWSENAITWNNQPGSAYNSFTPIPCSTNGYVHVDAKGMVREIVSGNKVNHGFFIVNELGTNFLRTLMTKESQNPPSLYVLYEAPAPSPTPTPTPSPDPSNPAGTTTSSSATSQTGITAGTNAAPATKTSSAIKPPTEITAKDAASQTKAAIKLSWKISESTNIDGYKIFRSEQEKEGFVNIALAEKGIAEFTDETVISGKTYYYFIRSYKGNTESESTATINAVSNYTIPNTGAANSATPKTSSTQMYILLGAIILLLSAFLLFYEINWKKKLSN